MKFKTSPITQSRLVECRVCKFSISDIPIIKIVVLSRSLFDLRVVSLTIIRQSSADLFFLNLIS